MRPLSELRLSLRTVSVTNTNMAASLVSLVPSGRGKMDQRGENHSIVFKLRAAAQPTQSLLSQIVVQTSRHDRVCRLSKYVFSKSDASAVV